MILIERRDYNHQIKIVMVLGIIIGLAWGFCAGMLFEQYHQRLKPPAPPVMKGIEF
jgi:hypothetical protein